MLFICIFIVSCMSVDENINKEDVSSFEELNLPETSFNYANQSIPNYIKKDNSNDFTDDIATLGRVLFYDKKLSKNNSISCAGCHKQSHAFSDENIQSIGYDGELTSRHSMRLINARFSEEVKFFWDERASSLEDQTTQPIKDHVEMGFSGNDGDPTFEDLILKLQETEYYSALFNNAFGDSNITEERIQNSLAQFVRSIQSFDSKFDLGLSSAGITNINQNFPNYSDEENLGKNLFLLSPAQGGAGGAGCHRAPEFDIVPNTQNNGVIGVAGNSSGIDLFNTRSPSLRDLFKHDGTSNGPFMHDGSFNTLLEVINHYNKIPNNPANTNLDHRLNQPGIGLQTLNLSEQEKSALISFIKTLSGSDVYTNEKWSDPFK